MLTAQRIPTCMTSTPVLLSAIAVIVSVAGCASGGGSGKFAATPNPFSVAGATSADQVQVNTLRVFGDSYTDPAYTGPRKIVNWAGALQGSGYATQVQNYALGGARAQFSQTISFDKQINRWRSRNSPIAERDLTVTYFGYNDIGRNGRSAASIASSKAGYAEGVNQLAQAGAASGTNRLFVTQIHDWSRNPGVNTANTQALIVDWNNFVGGLANSNPNIVAVDLFTVFNRVLNEPAKFGFNNVSTPDPARHGADALFYDDIHFGSRGEEIIARTFRHYLTRAWNWANALEAGSAAASQLSQDIDQGLLVLSIQQNGKAIPGTAFSLVPMGNTSSDRYPVPGQSFLGHAHGERSSAFSGVALNFSASESAWTGASQMGVALHQKNVNTMVASAEDRSTLDFQSHAASLYWVKPVSDFLFTTHFTQGSQSFRQFAGDDLVGRNINNTRQGSSWSLESKLRYTMGNPYVTVTPWASLTQSRQRLSAGSLQTLYTSDVFFDATQAKEWFSGVGVDLQFAPISFADGRKLHWGGSLMHRESLRRDPLVISMRETAQPSVVQRETIQRAGINQTYLGLNAQMDLSRAWNLSASYAADLKQTQKTQSVQLRASASF